jgi:hypothetical protein
MVPVQCVSFNTRRNCDNSVRERNRRFRLELLPLIVASGFHTSMDSGGESLVVAGGQVAVSTGLAISERLISRVYVVRGKGRTSGHSTLFGS